VKPCRSIVREAWMQPCWSFRVALSSTMKYDMCMSYQPRLTIGNSSNAVCPEVTRFSRLATWQAGAEWQFCRSKDPIYLFPRHSSDPKAIEPSSCVRQHLQECNESSEVRRDRPF
jgi:hypothetical protein